MNKVLSVYWLFRKDDYQSSIDNEIYIAFKESILDLGLIPDIDCINCCNTALDKINSEKQYKIRVFRTKKFSGCYVDTVLDYICMSQKNNYGINIEIVHEKQNKENYFCMDRKIILTTEQAKNKEIIKSLLTIFNENKKIYISYGNDKKTETVKTINTIKNIFNKALPFAEVKVDKDMEYKEDVYKFMNELTNGSHIIKIINEKYLKSKYCINEFIDIQQKTKNKNDFFDRIHPIIMKSGEVIYETEGLLPIVNFWQDKYKELAKLINANPDTCTSLKLDKRLSLYKAAEQALPEIAGSIGHWCASKISDHKKNNFSNLTWGIYESFYKKNTEKLFPLYNDKSELKITLESIKNKLLV